MVSLAPLMVVVIGLVLITVAVRRVCSIDTVTLSATARADRGPVRSDAGTPRAVGPDEQIGETAQRDGLGDVSLTGRGGVDLDVIIPARNEAHHLGELLGDIRCQTVGVSRVIVVDDESDDDTATVARAGGAAVLGVPERPVGWNPKVWALRHGVNHSDAERLLFLDADVRLAPDAVGVISQAADIDGGLVSVAPFHCKIVEGRPVSLGVAESLSAPFNITIVAGGGPGLARSARGAIGSCLTMRRVDYDHAGGHAANPSTIVDDLALASAVHDAGMPVTMYQSRPSSVARPMVAVRSYPGGAGDMARGWVKNMSAGLGKTPMLSALAVAAWVTSLLMPVAMIIGRRWLMAVVLWVLVGVHTGWLAGRVGRFQTLVTTLGAPVLGGWFALVSAISIIVRVTRRRVRWKDRPLRPDGLAR